MVNKAIKQKYEIFGISEHVPFLDKRDGSKFHNARPTMIQYKEYLKEMKDLKIKHKKDIDILIGLECEYYKEKKQLYLDFIKKDKIEYLIFGNHSSIFGEYYDTANLTKELLDRYVENTKQGLESGLFLYMAHPDFI
jgi:histidinol-phosphatase (PHP family)